MNPVVESAKFVAEQSKFVSINRTKLAEYAKIYSYAGTPYWLNASPFDFSALDAEERLNVLSVFNAISFCYWGEPKWTVEYRGKKHDGAFGMLLALQRAADEGKPITDFSYCAHLTTKELQGLLRANTEIPLLDERLQNLRELGEAMEKKFGGKASVLVGSAKGDAIKLLKTIAQEIPSFNDVSTYDGKAIAFHKRAQLFTWDTFELFKGHDFGAFSNIRELSACADYKLPQMLRKKKILEYSKELAQKVDSLTPIPAGSREEVEIRANTIWAIELLEDAIQRKDADITAGEINNRLWMESQTKQPNDKPYHRTRTTAY